MPHGRFLWLHTPNVYQSHDLITVDVGDFWSLGRSECSGWLAQTLMLTHLVEFYNLDPNDDVVDIHADVAASVIPLNLILFGGFFGFVLLQVILDCMTWQVHFAGPGGWKWMSTQPLLRFLGACVGASHLRLHDTSGPFCWALISGGSC
jgi:hypothetical protein